MELNHSKLKKILVFVDWYEPGFKGGGPIRSVVNLVNNLNSFYEFFIFTSDRDLGDAMPYKGISTDKWCTLNNTSIFYASPPCLNWKSISQQIKLISPDFIYLNGMYALYYAIYPLLMKRLGITSAKVILAPRGMLQNGALQFKAIKKKLFLNLISLLSIPKLINGHATDEQEKIDIYKHLPGINAVSVLPNFSSIPQKNPVVIKKDKYSVAIAFVSRISPKKNLLFFVKLLKNLASPLKYTFTIVGNIEDIFYWEECESIIKDLPKNIVVDYKGALKNDMVYDILSQHHIFVLPTEGENFGHAIFEALSMGRPVLLSDKTPWRNLQKTKAGWDLPLNNPAAFINVIKQVAEMDDKGYQLWSKGALQLANDYIIKSDLQNQYLKLFS